MAVQTHPNTSSPSNWILASPSGQFLAMGSQVRQWLQLDDLQVSNRSVSDLLGHDLSNEIFRVFLPGAACYAQVELEVNEAGTMVWIHPELQGDSCDYDEQMYRLVFESAASGLARLGLDGSFLDANDEFCSLVGYSRADINYLSFSDLVVGSDGDSLWSDLDRMLANNEKSLTCERLCVRADSSEFWVQLSLSLIKEVEGAPDCFVLVLKNISKLKDAEREANYLALFDTLTGLPNRRMLDDRINQALASAEREKREVAVLFLDLDRFKDVNDVLGHHCGDHLLIEVSQRLVKSVRKIDTVARIGGDEFVIILKDLVDGMGARHVAEKILRALSSPFDINRRKIYSGSSIGIARYPIDGADSETLLRHADAAMYHAKEQGRGTYRFFSDELNAAMDERLMLDNSMREALIRGEFYLEYQPQVELQTGRLIGVEALVRWRHPELGVILPDKFIPQAEENGLIAPLGRWVLEEACRQVYSWQQMACRDLRLTVNVSGRQFLLSDVADDVDRALEVSGLPPQCLEVELTEGCLMDRSEKTLMGLVDLKVRGVRLAIDDFGAGYSSLLYLQDFPVDCIKIDRSFLSGFNKPGDRAPIAEAIIGLAHNLGVKVFGEGVEKEAHRDFLLSRGCDEGQGFFFSTPMEPSHFEKCCRSLREQSEDAIHFPLELDSVCLTD